MFKTVGEEIKLERLSICNSCEDFNKTIKTCKQCGCYMPAKSMLAASSCPSNKWLETSPGRDLINTLEEMILESWNKK
jgi:hypothetical protein